MMGKTFSKKMRSPRKAAAQSPLRKRRSATTDEDDENEQQVAVESPKGSQRRRSSNRRRVETIDSEEGEELVEETQQMSSPRNKRMKLKEQEVASNGNRRQSNRSNRQQQQQQQQQQQLEEEEEDGDGNETEEEKEFEGDEHVDVDGNPVEEGKKFAFRTFNLLDRHPTRLYCCMLDLARSFGYNDSFRFMKVNRGLNRIDLDQEERDMVIEMNIIHPVMKYRNVPAISVPDAYVYFGLELFSAGKEATGGGSGGPSSSSWWAKTAGNSQQEDDSQQDRRAKLLAQGPLLPQVKPVKDPQVDGGDWLYRCAVSAAEFNALARRERLDRLYGEIDNQNSGDEGEDGDEDDEEGDEDDEEEFSEDSDDSERGHRKRRQRNGGNHRRSKQDRKATIDRPEIGTAVQQREKYRRGFHDIHTNINQLPLNTQPYNMRIQSHGLQLRDLATGAGQRAKNKEALQIQFVKHGSAPAHKPIKSQLSTLLDDRFGPTEDSAQRYPLAVMPGQFQGTISVYGSRFGYFGAQRIPIQTAPRIQQPQPHLMPAAAASQIFGGGR